MKEQRTPCEQAYIVFSDGKPTWEMDSRDIWDAAYQVGRDAMREECQQECSAEADEYGVAQRISLAIGELK